MKHQAIQASDAGAVDGISESCSEVTLGCSDVSGLVQSVLASSEKLRAEHAALLGTVATLNEDQDQVAQACDESRLLSQRAIDQLPKQGEREPWYLSMNYAKDARYLREGAVTDEAMKLFRAKHAAGATEPADGVPVAAG